MISDLGEVAQLATEFISTLDNLPQEVQHIVKEVEHKDAKVQEMLPKLAARESQLKELLLRKDVLTDLDKAKIEKLTDKIKVDYARADEWSNQKEQLTKKLWRSIVAHQRRLNQEVEKISPALIKQVEDTLPSQLQQQGAGSLGALTSSASLPAILANLKSPSVESDAFLTSAAGLKRKHGASSHLGRDSPHGGSHKSRHSSSDRMASPSLLTPSSSTNAFLPSSSHASISKKALKSSGLSSMLSKGMPGVDLDADLDADADADGDGTGDGEKDTKLYCHCQRVSFGEMIGCDSDDCQYEWFHLSCVGLSKPLPQTWYCEDCKERIEREKSEKPAKKRKR